MAREIVRADYEALFKQYADKAVKRFNMTGKHPPQLYAVKLGPEPGQIIASGSLNKIAPMFFNGSITTDDDHARGMFRKLLEELTTPGSIVRTLAVELKTVVPDVVVQINEAWMATQVKGKPGESAKHVYDREKDRPDRVRPRDDPERTEIIAIMLHTRNHTITGLCHIFDKPKRHAEIGGLSAQPSYGNFSMTIDDE